MNYPWEKIIEPSGIQISSREISEFETQLGLDLPSDYRKFLLNHNGGKIFVEHEIIVTEFSCNIFVNDLWPLSKPNPSLGINEARNIAVKNGFALKHAIEIGDDCGTGFFLLVLSGAQTGAVFFGWKEDVFNLKNASSHLNTNLPQCLIQISQDFDSLAEIILANSTWSNLD